MTNGNQCVTGAKYCITGTYGLDWGPSSSWGWRGTGGDRGLEGGGTYCATISLPRGIFPYYNPLNFHCFTIYRSVVSRTLWGQCSILILDQLSDRTIIQHISLARCSGYWQQSTFWPECQELEKSSLLSGFLTFIQAVWRIFFNTVSTTPSTRGLRSWLFIAVTHFIQERCASPRVQNVVCLNEAPSNLKSGLNTAVFWSCNGIISLNLTALIFVDKLWLCFSQVYFVS